MYFLSCYEITYTISLILHLTLKVLSIYYLLLQKKFVNPFKSRVVLLYSLKNHKMFTLLIYLIQHLWAFIFYVSLTIYLPILLVFPLLMEQSEDNGFIVSNDLFVSKSGQETVTTTLF